MSTSRLHRGLRATLLGLAANVLLASAKFAAGILGHSHALVADAVESLADILSSLLVWRALVVAATPADEDHPYGHGKAEPIAAAGVAIMLLMAAGWIIVESSRAMQDRHQAPAAFTLLVLVVVIAVKEGLFRFLIRESKAVQSSAVQTDAWHHRSDAITSLAAGIGISISLLGGPRFAAADDVAAIAAAAVIAWNGWRLLHPSLGELMDRAPSRELIDRIRRIAEGAEGVVRVEQCRARKMGYQLYVDMHIEVHPQMTVQRAHEIAHGVKDEIRAKLPGVLDVLVHIEPARREEQS